MDGCAINAIAACRAAMLHIVPEIEHYPEIKERMLDAQESWSKRAPAPTRLPLPQYAPWSVIGQVAEADHLLESLGLSVMLRAYLRPSELLKIKSDDIVSPTIIDNDSAKVYGLVLNSTEVERGDLVDVGDLAASKTGCYNENIIFDLEDELWTGQALARLARGKSKGALLFPFAREHLNKVYKEGVKECLAEHLGHTVYVMRHTGPSLDFLEARRPDSSIKGRAHWLSDASTRRYKQSTLALKQAQKWDLRVLRYGKEVQRVFPHFLAGKMKLPNRDW